MSSFVVVGLRNQRSTCGGSWRFFGSKFDRMFQRCLHDRSSSSSAATLLLQTSIKRNICLRKNLTTTSQIKSTVPQTMLSLSSWLQSSRTYVSETKKNLKADASSYQNSTTTATILEETEIVAEPPTRTQLWRVFVKAAIPMIGFGFIDQSVMLQAGNAIDCTLGVAFGLSTLTAAAFGQICSDACGVLFGGTLERIFTMLGLPSANLTSLQRKLPVVRRTRLVGSFLGVIMGCCLGLLNLLFIDTNRSSTLKLQAFNEESEFEFTIEASNSIRKDCTALTVRGPDIDGLLASMTAALAVRGCSLVELHAKRSHHSLQNENDTIDPTDNEIEDIFYVVKRETGEPFPDDELEELARGLLDSTRTPMNVNSVKAAMHELESTNSFLQARIRKLEEAIYKQQITIIPSSGEAAGEE